MKLGPVEEELFHEDRRTDMTKTNSEVNISHETTTMVVWIYDGI